MSVLAPHLPIFRAAAEALLPAAAHLDEAQWDRLEQIVETVLSQRPERARKQLRLFLRVLDLYPLPRHRRRFHRLSLSSRERVLHNLERARHILMRRGVWGLRTLVFMGYYTQPVHAAGVGYRASARGWQARR